MEFVSELNRIKAEKNGLLAIAGDAE